MKNVTIIKNTMTPSLNKIKKDLLQLPKLAYEEWLKNTPVRDGNARRKTKLVRNQIVADYPYAKRLDEGYSKQSPKGMSEPTEKFVQLQTDKIMRK